jgi:hypothetical protein
MAKKSSGPSDPGTPMPAEWSFDHNMRSIMFSHWYTAAREGGAPVFNRSGGAAPAADPAPADAKPGKPPTF